MAAEDLRTHEERNGDRFDAAMMMEARDRTQAAIGRIAGEIVPDMIEEDAVALARRLLKEAGLLRGWHGVHVRFGVNTLKNFGEASQPGVVLQARDIFFIDIGPVWQGYEGDGGATFVVGDDADMLRAQQDVVAVYEATRAAWIGEGLTGAELYRFAEREAAMRGWMFNLDMSGHRLSDFPHAVKHDGALSQAPYRPSSGLWVLEIHIRHPTRAFGAFHEDLLVR